MKPMRFMQLYKKRELLGDCLLTDLATIAARPPCHENCHHIEDFEDTAREAWRTALQLELVVNYLAA